MARPVKPRTVSFLPAAAYFGPAETPPPGARGVNLSLDEWEAVRLKDYLGLDQEECARLMEVAQSSLQRILTSARAKLACALVEGQAISIGGGTYQMVGRGYCPHCRREWRFPSDPDAPAHRRCPSCGKGDIDRRGLGYRGWVFPGGGEEKAGAPAGPRGNVSRRGPCRRRGGGGGRSHP